MDLTVNIVIWRANNIEHHLHNHHKQCLVSRGVHLFVGVVVIVVAAVVGGGGATGASTTDDICNFVVGGQQQQQLNCRHHQQNHYQQQQQIVKIAITAAHETFITNKIDSS